MRRRNPCLVKFCYVATVWCCLSACGVEAPLVKASGGSAGSTGSEANANASGTANTNTSGSDAANTDPARTGEAEKSQAEGPGDGVYSVTGNVAIANELPANAEYNQLSADACAGSMFVAAREVGGIIRVSESEREASWNCPKPGFFFGPAPGTSLPFVPGKRTFRLSVPPGFRCSNRFQLLPEALAATASLDVNSCELTFSLQTPTALNVTFFVDDQRRNNLYELSVTAVRKGAVPSADGRHLMSQKECPNPFIFVPALEAKIGNTSALWDCQPLARFGTAEKKQLPYSPGWKKISLVVPKGSKCAVRETTPQLEMLPVEGDDCSIWIKIVEPRSINVVFEVDANQTDNGGFFRVQGQILAHGEAQGDARWFSKAACTDRQFQLLPDVDVTLSIADQTELHANHVCPTRNATDPPSFYFGAPRVNGLDFVPGWRNLQVILPSDYKCVGYEISPNEVFVSLEESMCLFGLSQTLREDVMLKVFIARAAPSGN